MDKAKLHKVFIWGFSILYLFVAGISFFHAIEFFEIGNNTVMSIMLALAFEVGLALSLVAILLSDDNRKNVLPWMLMIILTAVQIMGNVYSVFKFIALSGQDYYAYLHKSLLFFIEEVSKDTVMVSVSWIMGAILPIISLFMTDMVASNIKMMNKAAVADTAKSVRKAFEPDRSSVIPNSKKSVTTN